MKTKHVYFLAVVIFILAACNKDENLQVKKEIFTGYAQKGPFVNGSSVTIAELDKQLDQTGKTYLTTISDNSGSFEKKNIELISNYVELKVDGYYFNEVAGKTSTGTLTLNALADVSSANSANVNVLTHLEKPRVEYLVKQGMNFSLAKQQAQAEVLAIFGFAPSTTSFETMNLTDDAALLAVSCIMQSYLSTGDMMELMANISADIKTDGKLDNMVLGSKLINNAFAVSIMLSEIRDNLTNKYAQLGINIAIPDFESYIESFLNSNLYPQTSFITYPASGSHGSNILSEAVTTIKGGAHYSMKADVPDGHSLKIILKNSASWASWSIQMSPDGPVNWEISSYDENNRRQTFTVIESGKPNDLKFITEYVPNGEYITVEYYENGATSPTKTRTLYFE
jgi:hypothetical protein